MFFSLVWEEEGNIGEGVGFQLDMLQVVLAVAVLTVMKLRGLKR